MIEFLLHLALPRQKFVHVRIGHFFSKLRVDLVKLFQQVDSFLDRFFHYLTHGARVVDQRFLFQITNGKAWRDNGLAIDLLVNAGEYAQQRRLARTIQTDHANLRAVEIGKVDVFKDRLLVVKLADADHRINNFVGFSAHDFLTQAISSRRKCKLTVCFTFSFFQSNLTVDYTDYAKKEKAQAVRLINY